MARWIDVSTTQHLLKLFDRNSLIKAYPLSIRHSSFSLFNDLFFNLGCEVVILLLIRLRKYQKSNLIDFF